MATKTFYFNDNTVLEKWVVLDNYFQIQTNGLELMRKWKSEFSVLEGITLTGLSGTTIDATAPLTDEEDSTFSIVSKSSTQIIKYDLTSLENVQRLDIRLVRGEVGETWTNITYEVSKDDVNYVELPIQDSDIDDDELYVKSFISIDLAGTQHRYGKLTFAGSSLNANQVVVREIKGFISDYPYNSKWIEHKEFYHVESLSAISATTTGSGSLKIQLSRDGVFYYYDGSSWEFVGTDERRWYEDFSNTIADANTNIATFIPSSTEYEVGMRIFLFDDIALESIVLTT